MAESKILIWDKPGVRGEHSGNPLWDKLGVETEGRTSLKALPNAGWRYFGCGLCSRLFVTLPGTWRTRYVVGLINDLVQQGVPPKRITAAHEPGAKED
jgi:hypothetical protein